MRAYSLAGSCALLIGLVAIAPVHAQSVNQRVATLEEQVNQLQDRLKKFIDLVHVQNTALTQLTALVSSQGQAIGQLQQQNTALQATLGCMSKSGNDVFFTGCNVHVRSGSGATDGELNGLGNLVIGYNEDAVSLGAEQSSAREGSHNLIVGPGHSYTSYGGLVAGRLNSVHGSNSSVTGGGNNIAFGFATSISGGRDNRTNGGYTHVAGGASNAAFMGVSSILGGEGNQTSGAYSTISGGLQNRTDGFSQHTSITGGSNNYTHGMVSSITGGSNNITYAGFSSISGGTGNTTGDWGCMHCFAHSTVTGGSGNRAAGTASSVSGGLNRTSPDAYDWAGGGLLEDQ
jgi:hypothetical protein